MEDLKRNGLPKSRCRGHYQYKDASVRRIGTVGGWGKKGDVVLGCEFFGFSARGTTCRKKLFEKLLRIARS